MPSFAHSGRSWPPLTTDLAVRFVERESAGFAAALREPGDPRLLREALRWHDDAHRPWLALLATCEVEWPSATRLHRLYAFHGRLAELLQRDCAGDRPGRALLDAHLHQLTRDAVAALRPDTASQVASTPRRRGAADPFARTLDSAGPRGTGAQLGRVPPTGTHQPPDAASESPRRSP